jgi:hypothetical protein
MNRGLVIWVISVLSGSLENLKAQTTYYYTVGSMQATGKSDGVKSSVNRFTTP